MIGDTGETCHHCGDPADSPHVLAECAAHGAAAVLCAWCGEETGGGLCLPCRRWEWEVWTR
jgi:hypothetical protein